MKKLIALFILAFPIYLAGLGIKWMRDAVFGVLTPQLQFIWLQFIIGLILAVCGIAFVGGYILHMEKRNKRVQKKFIKQDKN